MNWTELIFGRPLRSEEQEAQRIGPLRGIPVLGLDALASAAYGPEAALTVLIVLGAAGTRYIAPISAVIVVLLAVVYVSYRQTIATYPNGGGAYTVASENLGEWPALLAASALAVDYILNTAVAISAGVGAIVSAAPALLPHTLLLCLGILLLLTIVNLRGVREAGLLFMLPTYAFLAALGGVVALGAVRVLAGGHPVPVQPQPSAMQATESLHGLAGAWLIVRAFAAGCTAMTGVEAVSNGVPLFKDPVVKHARRTLTAIIVALALLLIGIAVVAQGYGITATVPGATGYRSVISQLTAAVMGTGVVYYVTMISAVAVLCLSANTSFAGFPRLCRVLALDGYLPAEFAHPGRRLVYSVGIILLALVTALLLTIFRGVTDHLIPLFAVGAFLTFTMSQAGMVAHWRRVGGKHARRSLVMNGSGAVATAITLIVVLASKFTEGAWITALVIPALVLLFRALRAHEERLDAMLDVDGPIQLDEPPPPIVLVPIKRLDRVARKALRMAISISPDVHVVQVFAQDLEMENLQRHWRERVELPLRGAGFTPPRLVLLQSPYRDFFGPLLRYVKQVADATSRRYVAVVVPELFEARWYQRMLGSHRATLLKALLLLRGGPRVIVINTPWHVGDDAENGAEEREGEGERERETERKAGRTPDVARGPEAA